MGDCPVSDNISPYLVTDGAFILFAYLSMLVYFMFELHKNDLSFICYIALGVIFFVWFIYGEFEPVASWRKEGRRRQFSFSNSNLYKVLVGTYFQEYTILR